MVDETDYPDEPVGGFPEPPVHFTDREGRALTVERYEASDRPALREMYLDFDPADRAQGIPPTGADRIAAWLDAITGEGSFNVVAWHDDRAVGHATLVPDEPAGTYELAIFVLQSHQHAGIGTHLIETLLGYGRAEGVERVWLSVERWNEAAIALYEKEGFRTATDESFEREMTLRLR